MTKQVHDFTPEEIDELLANIDKFTPAEAAEIEKMVDELATRREREGARDDLIKFCLYMDPNYKVGRHHRILADRLMAIERGLDAEDGADRVCVNIPPRHGKSQMVSIYFPAWFIGRNPGKKVMMVSHTTDLAVDFGRKVRNLIDTVQYKNIFPTVGLATDSKSAGRWNTNFGGEYFACGIGSSIAGRGADLLLVDDPHSEQDVLNGNFDVFQKAYEWFTYGARTRLMPGGRVAIVQCMTGDTPVLRPDGRETPLRDIRPGDKVMSYKEGQLVAQRVLNHRSNGLDCVYTIKMTSGITVRANERHPFLVDRDGVLQWVRVKNLQVNECILTVTGVSGKALSAASITASNPHTVKGSVTSTITKNAMMRALGGEALKKIAMLISNTVMGLRWNNTMHSLLSKAVPALYANSLLQRKIRGRIGTTNSVLTIATPEGTCAPYSVMTAISQLGMQKPSKLHSLSQNTSAFTVSKIESITPSGDEEVFDIQVENTENFIANGLVSHNTRWHMDDLTGRVVRDMTQNEGSDQYEVIEFPAILEVEKFNENTGDVDIVQKPLWPEFFDLPALLRTKASMPVFQWNSQYQQQPTAEEAAVVKREWWQWWEDEDPPKCEYIIMSLDAAAETNNRADFTALTTWGVFTNEEAHDEKHIILLNSIKRRMEFPELKALCLEENNMWEPDAFIVEKKSAGTAIFQELRRMGILVQEFTPHRGTGDKMARLNSVSDIIASGLVWVPQTRWAEEVVEEIAGFPFSSHDDLVDSSVMALLRFRQGGFIRLPTDEREDEMPYQRKVDYY